jgi:sortase (surface protein transpeptidase)
VIPSIALRAAMTDVGLASDGRIETPPYKKANLAAWYRIGPSPGERGSAVILGHVDSKKSVAVFFYLTRMRPGDRIEVTRADRQVAIFTVDSVERVAKADFPTERVYGPTEGAELRLVTCGGRYDRAREAWLDNIIVFAHMTGARARG